MAVQPNAVDTHPQREMIVDAIIAGESLQELAKRCNPPLNPCTLWRYRSKKIRPVLQKQADAVTILQNKGLLPKGEIAVQAVQDASRSVLAADPILARLAHRQAERDRIAKLAEDSADLRTWSTLDRNDLAAVELHAKLTGRLNTATDARTVVIVVPPGSPQAQAAVEDEGPVIDITPGE